MAGLDKAGLDKARLDKARLDKARSNRAETNSNLSIATDGSLSSRRFFSMIAWLRWRIFVNTLRATGARTELAIKILSYPVLALIVLGPSVGAGISAWYLVSKGMDAYLAIPLWIIFGLWQFIGVSTSATGPSFDLNTLTRFPIRYRDYLLMRLSFGLLDPPTLAGIGCLLATSIGIAVAAPAMFPWSALTLLVYAACNVLFSRMVYSWSERWLAQRRTRELFTGLVLVLSLGFQFASQFLNKFTRGGPHAHLSPTMERAAHILLQVNWVLPPGLAASAIDHMHRGLPLFAVAALAALLVYSTLFLAVLHLRLRAQYMGENLGEAPAAAKAKVKTRRLPSASATVSAHRSYSLLSSSVSALLVKEIRLLLRSGTKLYTLVMPVFVVFLFSFRSSGFQQMGMGSSGLNKYLFTYGCAYAQLIFVNLLYNSLGSDGTGAQFYFVAPVRMRDVVLAKNLLTGGILFVEMALIYLVATMLSARASLALTAATVAWSAFAFFLNTSIGNVRSLTAPKGYDPAKLRRQNVGGLSSFISLVVVFAAVGLGWGTLFLCRFLHISEWIAAAGFFVLACIAFSVYIVVLRQLDTIAANNVENLMQELSKA